MCSRVAGQLLATLARSDGLRHESRRREHMGQHESLHGGPATGLSIGNEEQEVAGPQQAREILEASVMGNGHNL